ncbi:hypothetical protein PMAYCL1PPCAC_32522, partial [Pristionchus mayeri]
LPPFKYNAGHIVSELGSRSSLAVAKDKKQIRVVTLKKVYRASRLLIDHYSTVFYKGALDSDIPTSGISPLAHLEKVIKKNIGKRCIFWKVMNGINTNAYKSTSKKNYQEANAVQFVLMKLIDSKTVSVNDVMIIALYEDQRKYVAAKLKERCEEREIKERFEVLTVDSAQGREKRIVFVLTTRSEISRNEDIRKPTSEIEENSEEIDGQAGGIDPEEKAVDFFSSPYRCNVAVSRHQEALIVFGHPNITNSEYWGKVLDQKYFYHHEDNSSPTSFTNYN